MSEYSPKDCQKVLEEKFNFLDFKNVEQKYAIECIANEKFKDIIISMATQAGKSLCYQLPVLMKNSGVVLVISPTISLISNQIDYLTKNKIQAVSITGALSFDDRDSIIAKFSNYAQNPYRFLYVTPEMLIKGNIAVRNLIDKLLRDNQINLVAVDEAHVIIDSSDSFRGCYLKLGEIRKTCPNIPWVALTTASKEVASNIGSALEMKKPEIIIGPSVGKDIFYNVLKVKTENFEIEKLISFDDQLNQCSIPTGIIFCRTITEVDNYVDKLTNAGIASKSYYAAKEDRQSIQDDWMNGAFPILVATDESFGMGIQRTPLHFVVHIGIPKNLRGYYQQSGRVNGDGGYSRIILLNDKIYYCDQEMMNFLSFTGCRHEFIAQYFGDKTVEPCLNKCDNCILKKLNL